MSSFWTSLPAFSGRNKLTGIFARGAMLVLCLFALSSCGRVTSWFGDDEPAAQTAKTSSTTTASATAGTAPVPVPPGADNRPLLPGQSGGAHTPDGMPALQPRGMKVEELFAENIKDPVERVKRVENAVVELRRDFDSVLPAIVRLTAVEQDMQELLKQLESLLRSEPPAANAPNYAAGAPQPLSTSAAPVPTAQSPPPRPAAAPASAPPVKAAAPGTLSVTGLRVGEHADKTRLVMDVTGPVTYRYDLDNAENLLVIELPGAAWSATASQTLQKSPRVQSYSAQAIDGGGSRVIVQLRRAATVAYESMLRPENGGPHRLILDLR